jgi:hypothetical protein
VSDQLHARRLSLEASCYVTSGTIVHIALSNTSATNRLGVEYVRESNGSINPNVGAAPANGQFLDLDSQLASSPHMRKAR